MTSLLNVSIIKMFAGENQQSAAHPTLTEDTDHNYSDEDDEKYNNRRHHTTDDPLELRGREDKVKVIHVQTNNGMSVGRSHKTTQNNYSIMTHGKKYYA